MVVFESLSSFIENGGVLNEGDRPKRPRMPIANRFAEASVSADGQGVYKQGNYNYNDVNNPKNKYTLKKNNMSNPQISEPTEKVNTNVMGKSPKVLDWESKLGRTLNNAEQYAIDVSTEELKKASISTQVKIKEIRDSLQRSLKYAKFSAGLDAEFAKLKNMEV
ncbi:MAG: hypothetical protein ACRDD8_14165 [Bacteroidales bacterium]